MPALLAFLLRSRWASAACAAVVVLALLLPAHGIGLPMCQFHLATGLPCLGCGLTRSFIGAAHLRWDAAGFYHPLGLVLFPLCCGLAALLPAPSSVRARLAAAVEARGRWCAAAAVGLGASFLLYGFGRIIWLLATATPSPW